MNQERIERERKTRSLITDFIIRQFARTVVVFLRFDFGERYFNIADMWGASFTFVIYGVMVLVFLTTQGTNRSASYTGRAEDNGAALLAFLICFVLMCIIHQLVSWVQKQSGRRWHSRYSGTSYLRIFTALPLVDSYIVQRYIEPVLAVTVGGLLVALSPALGAWLVLSGICLAVTEHLDYARARNRLLDALDSQIEAQNLGAVIAGGKSAQETEGFILPVPRRLGSGERKVLLDGMMRLDPDLQAILDTPEAPPTPTAKPAQPTASATAGAFELDPELKAMLDS